MGSVDEAAAVEIARRCVSSNDTWATQATYSARRHGAGWSVTASRIEGYGTNGEPRFTFGGDRFLEIDEHGAVTSHKRGL